MTTKDKIIRARISLLLDQPFFGTLLLNLKMVEDKPGHITQTMATDGNSLWWHPPFVDSLEEGVLPSVLVHECLHPGLQHHLRRQQRDPVGWNIATDHCVNNLLEAYNQQVAARGRAVPFPWGSLKDKIYCDPAHKDKSAEQIYNELPTMPNAGSGPGSDHGIGGVLDAPGADSPAAQQEQEAKWKIAMVQAATAAKQQGKLPAGLARLVDEQLNPPARWQDILRHFIRQCAKDDFSWRHPSRRYMASGFILPSLYSQRLGRIAVAIDTSGSIGGDLLNQFLGEVEAIIHECRPEKLLLIDCDAQVNSIRELDPTDPIPREFAGGGGTSHVPIWEALRLDPPVACICLTDMATDFGEDPGYPVIWAAYDSDTEAPFGETIKIQ